MHFRVEHTFTQIDLERYEALYFDEPFNIALCEAIDLRRELKTHELNARRLVRVVTVGPEREIPPAAAGILKTNRIEYTEHIDYTFGQYQGTWKTVSSVLTDKVDSRGTFEFIATEGGVRRVVVGDIKVKLFGVGGVVEKFIVGDIERSYEKAATFTQSWIDQGKV